MKLSNKAGLPEPIVRAIQHDPYDKGEADFSVTELLQLPRARALIKAHRDEIEEDAVDRIWSLIGQIGHLILERAAGSPLRYPSEGEISERRFVADVGKYKITGRADLIISDKFTVLVDYKFTSLWTVKDGLKDEWRQQPNILDWLANENGVKIDKAEIVAIYRDWSKPRAQRERDYPQVQAGVFPVKLWSHDEQREFIEERIFAHIDAERKLPLCSDEERWKDSDKYAVVKHGANRAYKLYDNLAQAQAAAAMLGRAGVEFRKAVANRCENYCLAAPFCEQFQSEKREELF
jgi:hypothetical protein